MFRRHEIVFIIILSVLNIKLFSQKNNLTSSHHLNWENTLFIEDKYNGETKAIFNFNGVNYNREKKFIPFLTFSRATNKHENLEPIFNVASTEILSDEEEDYIKKNWELKNTFEISSHVGISANQKINTCEIIPFRKNLDGKIEKLIDFNFDWKINPTSKNNYNEQNITYVNNSVLSNGNWYKIAVYKNGIYKIDHNFLKTLGINLENLDPRTIQIYGNGGRILSEKNADAKFDDLIENAIYVSGENDGVFNIEDYILFYGKGTHQWEYNSTTTNDLKFNYIKNYYSDTTYYYLTVNTNQGKRISTRNSLTESENYTSTSFDDFAFHEIDASNLIKSGREFYGEYFDINTEYIFGFNFPEIVQGDTMFVKSSLVGRNQFTTTTFNMQLPDNSNLQFVCSSVGTSYTAPAGDEEVKFKKFIYTGSSIPQIKISKQTSSSTGWIDYIRINARRNLIQPNNILSFRDSRSVGIGRKTKFIITNYTNEYLWDVTNHHEVVNQLGENTSGIFEFKTNTDVLREFVSFKLSDAISPIKIGKIENQNLHASGENVDYIIITHPNFKSQAKELAELHLLYDTLNYVIATPDEIYNEFSSGTPDISAIREFVRMIYKKNTKKPRYLLLFGDGSYNNKSRDIATNSNLIPTYQTQNSLVLTASKVIDDFYGFLDDNEGNGFGIDIVDIGIGRLPVKTVQEAQAMVEKVKHYYIQQSTNINESNACDNSVYNTFGDWRNWITLMSDDAEDSWELSFVSQHNEAFANQIKNIDPSFNIDKIYLDAYKQYSTSGGQKYPDAESDLNKRISKGTLIFNYSGHGGELQLTGEGVIDNNVVNSWTNLNSLPMFVTATCEFSRFDDPSRTSCGENVLLNPKGGGICLFTTTRIAFSSDANSLGPAFFNAALNQLNGWYPRTGDIIRLTKQGSNRNYTHFCLLGDPAVTLAYPKEHIFTSQIKSSSSSTNTNNIDTLKALSKISIKGYIGDKNGNKLNDFNGVVYPTIFDKATNQTTLGNDLGPAGLLNFNIQKNVLYKGKANVKNGEFEFSFMIPKDINYQYGNGKISYYAHNGIIDASGYKNDVIIGGSSNNIETDKDGPEIKLFLNDDNFVRGGTTNENPKIFMKLTDSSGVNTVGSGIGHDIVAILDNNVSAPFVLNDYYEADLNSFQKGKIYYPLTDLKEGNHNLSVRVWDIQNNSSNENTEFIVAGSAELALKQVLNYPNPFTTSTKFYLEHNKCCSSLNLSIQIFTVSGKLIKTINRAIYNEGFRIDGIEWDGKDEFGDKLAKGVYLYKVKLRSSEGDVTEKIEKLVILN
jgi:hypothetical protein